MFFTLAEFDFQILKFCSHFQVFAVNFPTKQALHFSDQFVLCPSFRFLLKFSSVLTRYVEILNYGRFQVSLEKERPGPENAVTSCINSIQLIVGCLLFISSPSQVWQAHLRKIVSLHPSVAECIANGWPLALEMMPRGCTH